jgi:hypothetical protein
MRCQIYGETVVLRAAKTAFPIDDLPPRYSTDPRLKQCKYGGDREHYATVDYRLGRRRLLYDGVFNVPVSSS